MYSWFRLSVKKKKVEKKGKKRKTEKNPTDPARESHKYKQ